MPPEAFMINRERAIDYINTRDRVYVVDGYAGWDQVPRSRTRTVLPRLPRALHAQHARRPQEADKQGFEPDLVIFNAGDFPANRYVADDDELVLGRPAPRSATRSASGASGARWSSSAPSTPGR